MCVSVFGRPPPLGGTRSVRSRERCGVPRWLLDTALDSGPGFDSVAVDGDRLEHHVGFRAVVGVGFGGSDLTDDVHTVDDLPEHRVATVEVRRRVERDEKLRAVRVRPRVSHAEDARAVVGQLVVELVVELVAGTTAAGAGRVATLDHEAVDDAVKENVVVERLIGDSLSRLGIRPLSFARRQADEVPDRARCALFEQLYFDVTLTRVQGRRWVAHTHSEGGAGENDGGLSPTYMSPAVVSTAMTTGTHTATELTLETLPSGVALTTTVHTYDGADDGPTLYVQGAQHGREINGTEVLRRFHDRLPTDALSGTVIAVPVANPLTFDRVSYTTPEILDSVNPNMNRVWPGDDSGSLHQRMAARLWEHVSRADAVVDLHTGSPDMLPHVVYPAADDDARALAEAFGIDLLLAEDGEEDASEEWHHRGFAGKLRVAAAADGIPSITPELAHNKQILEEVVENGVEGLFGVLRYLGMLDGETTDWNGTLARNHLGQVNAVASGLFRADPALELGQHVTAGTELGTVYHPATYEPLQRARADREGILFTLTREATVVAGDKLASVALER